MQLRVLILLVSTLLSNVGSIIAPESLNLILVVSTLLSNVGSTFAAESLNPSSKHTIVKHTLCVIRVIVLILIFYLTASKNRPPSEFTKAGKTRPSFLTNIMKMVDTIVPSLKHTLGYRGNMGWDSPTTNQHRKPGMYSNRSLRNPLQGTLPAWH